MRLAQVWAGIRRRAIWSSIPPVRSWSGPRPISLTRNARQTTATC